MSPASFTVPLSNHAHAARSRISLTRQRFSLLNGRVSINRTLSPVWHSFFSSWAFTFVRFRIYFLYTGWRTRRFTITTTVFSILSLATTPVNTFRFPLSPIPILRRSPPMISPPLAGGNEGEGVMDFVTHLHPTLSLDGRGRKVYFP